MALVKVSLNGSSGGFGGGNPAPGVRGEIRGWSIGAARRCAAFLWTVDSSGLDAVGWSITFTVRDIPDSADDWASARDALLKAGRRAGMVRFHWVTEWTGRGVPHLHMAVYGSATLGEELLAAWLRISSAAGFAVSLRAQHVVPVHDAVGWFAYVSKHSARGVAHYQRQGIPSGWSKSGRLWGKGGAWPVRPVGEFHIDNVQLALVRSLVADYVAEQTGLSRRSALRPFDGFSAWIPAQIMLGFLQASGVGPDQFRSGNHGSSKFGTSKRHSDPGNPRLGR